MMSHQAIFSSQSQLREIAHIVERYCQLPVSLGAIPGAFVEAVLAHVRGASVLATYDHIDVLHSNLRVGWSIKSTKEGSPLTWKRVKIPNKDKLIADSVESEEGCQRLGDSIINFCNDHARASLDRYDLDAIGYPFIPYTHLDLAA